MILKALKIYFGCYRRHLPYVLLVAALIGVYTLVNISTILSDRAGVGLPVDWRAPTLFEVSSAFTNMLALPVVMLAMEAWPPTLKRWPQLLPRYVLASMAFSAIHVSGFVVLRTLVYPMVFDGNYNFLWDGYRAIPYEYWKDVRSVLLLGPVFHLMRELGRERQAAASRARQLELRSGATRILLDPAEFLYAKAAANYAEIVTLSGESLARITLTELEEKLHEGGVQAVRVHRSTLVGRTMIQQIDPLPGGDMKLTLKGGATVRASRRYKAALA